MLFGWIKCEWKNMRHFVCEARYFCQSCKILLFVFRCNRYLLYVHKYIHAHNMNPSRASKIKTFALSLSIVNIILVCAYQWRWFGTIWSTWHSHDVWLSRKTMRRSSKMKKYKYIWIIIIIQWMNDFRMDTQNAHIQYINNITDEK